MLLQALVACAGVTLAAVAVARGIEVTGTVRAEGDLDFRGTLGLDPEAPVGFAAIRLLCDLTSATDEADLTALIAATERYCVVLQTLQVPPEVTTSFTASAPRTTGPRPRSRNHATRTSPTSRGQQATAHRKE